LSSGYRVPGETP